jgi:hypothetical protein
MRLGIPLAIAVLVAGCGDPARQANGPATTSPTTARPITAQIAGPPVPHPVAGDLQTILNPAALEPITEVTVTPGLNAGRVQPPSAAAVPGLVATAVPLTPTDPAIDQWQYAPWYTASFTAVGRRWSLNAYLGGLGLLTDDAGHRAMVRLGPHNHDGT